MPAWRLVVLGRGRRGHRRLRDVRHQRLRRQHQRAMLTAFSSAERVTFTGSMMPVRTCRRRRRCRRRSRRSRPSASCTCVDDDGAFEAGVLGDLAQSAPRALRESRFDAGALVAVRGSCSQLVERRCARMSATPPPGTMPSSTAARVALQRVLDAELLLLQLDLGGGADLDDGDAAGELRQPLLQLLAVEVASRVLDLGLDLLDAGLDRLVGAVPSMIVVSSLSRRRGGRGRGRRPGAVQLAGPCPR